MKKKGGQIKNSIYEQPYQDLLYRSSEIGYGDNAEYTALFIEQIKKGASDYLRKKIYSGEMLEIKFYPRWDTKSKIGRAAKVNASTNAQTNLNDRNAREHLIRLVHANFTQEDMMLGLTYEDGQLPDSYEQGVRNVQNFTRSLNRYNRRVFGATEPIKFVEITEYSDDPNEPVRHHHHFITDFPDRTVAEKLWKHAKYTNSKSLQYDEFGVEALITYVLKNPRGKRRYTRSKYLKKPIIPREAKIRRGDARYLLANRDDARRLFENGNEGYRFSDMQVYGENKECPNLGGLYIKVRMRRYQTETEYKQAKRLRDADNRRCPLRKVRT